MEFNKFDLSMFSCLAESRAIVLVEGKNGLGQKFKTIGCFMPDRNSMGEYIYIQEQGFALFQGEYNNKGEKQYCAFFISPDYNESTKDDLFVETIKTREGKIIYKNPDFQRVQAFGFYNKMTRPEGYDYTPSRIHDTLLMHIGKPMTYKKDNGTLLSLETKNDVLFAVFSTGTKKIEGIVEAFDVHSSNSARKNLLDYSNGFQNDQ